jgi:hypothetical protein
MEEIKDSNCTKINVNRNKTIATTQSWTTRTWNAETRKFKWYPCFYEQKEGEKMKKVSLARGIELMMLGIIPVTDAMIKWLNENSYSYIVDELSH